MMDGNDNIESKVEELLLKLRQDIDNHYKPGAECLSENQHFELWDSMMELEDEKRRRLVQ